MKRVLVVGAGIHGLVTAAREHLAKNQVFVIEKERELADGHQRGILRTSTRVRSSSASKRGYITFHGQEGE